jgi:hypothetical protein
VKSNDRARLYGVSLAGALALAALGCATAPPFGTDAGLVVETNAAPRYEIHRVQVRRYADALSVSGDVEHSPPARILAPGQVTVSIVGADGRLLAEETTTPMRTNTQARNAHFYVRLLVDPPADSRVRITHRLD